MRNWQELFELKASQEGFWTFQGGDFGLILQDQHAGSWCCGKLDTFLRKNSDFCIKQKALVTKLFESMQKNTRVFFYFF